jgi:hypothetical protein
MTKPNISANKTSPIANSGNQGGIRMWPSEDWASKLYDLANLGLIIGLIIGVISTVVVVWMGNVKEEYLKRELAVTGQHAANANSIAATANERAAELEKENLKLQQKLANRRITKEQHDFLVDFLSKRRGTIIIETMSDSESGLYAADLLKTFIDAHWKIGGKHFPTAVIWIGLNVLDSSDPDASTVAEAFKAAGIPFNIGTEKREKATIMIGGKAPMF